MAKARVNLGGWEDHWKRVLRWHARLKRICNGIPQGLTREDAIDEVLVFFPTCYHLCDSLIRSGHSTEQAVEKFIRSNDALALCRDMAIAVKHFEISKPYIQTNYVTTTHMPPPMFIGPTRCEPVPGQQWQIETDAGRKDIRSSNEDPRHASSRRRCSSSVRTSGATTSTVGAFMRTIGDNAISPSASSHVKNRRNAENRADKVAGLTMRSSRK
jgi:hypothetical protein